MKTNAIVRIVIWSFVVVVLVGILAAFLAEEQYMNSYSVESVPMTIEEANAASKSDTEAMDLASPDTPLPNEETLTLDPSVIREIEIEWVAGNIIVRPMDVSEIMVSESDVTDEKYAMRWSIHEQELRIQFCEGKLTSRPGISLRDEFSKDLYIYVPYTWNCEALEVDAASATLEIADLTIRELDFDGADGTCTIENCDITDLDIDTASGDVTFSGNLNTLDFDAASASFIGDFQNIPNRIDMDGMSGKLDITLPEDCGYTLKMDGMSSSFHTDFQETRMVNDAHVYGNGQCRINVDGMSCDVTIRNGGPSLSTEETSAP